MQTLLWNFPNINKGNYHAERYWVQAYKKVPEKTVEKIKLIRLLLVLIFFIFSEDTKASD